MDEWLMPGIPRTIAEDPSMETVRRIRASVTSDTGQVVESDLLLDCPFCGGRPYVQVHELGETCVEARVVCPSCHVSTARETQSWRVWHGADDLTRTLAIGRAISSWNRRAESAREQRRTRRTCRYVRDHMGVADNWFSRCSECGAEFDERVVDSHFVYCPNCGAMVVSE